MGTGARGGALSCISHGSPQTHVPWGEGDHKPRDQAWGMLPLVRLPRGSGAPGMMGVNPQAQ